MATIITKTLVAAPINTSLPRFAHSPPDFSLPPAFASLLHGRPPRRYLPRDPFLATGEPGRSLPYLKQEHLRRHSGPLFLSLADPPRRR